MTIFRPLLEQNLLRSFGRVRGRRFSLAQHELFSERFSDNAIDVSRKVVMETLFPFLPQQIWLEIGFGDGSHLAALAQRYPEYGFIGCEVFTPGVAQLLRVMGGNEKRNIRIFHGDIRILIPSLPHYSLERIFILYPDPWPKLRQQKNRLVSAAFLDSLAPLLKEHGEVYLATDHEGYAQTMGGAMDACQPLRLVEKVCGHALPSGWYSTKYYKKASAAGKKSYFFLAQRTIG